MASHPFFELSVGLCLMLPGALSILVDGATLRFPWSSCIVTGILWGEKGAKQVETYIAWINENPTVPSGRRFQKESLIYSTSAK